ncbi:MAG: 50S ribosomal protein L35 [Isosphaeraceae bacterium]|nr:50S ribosomal protein L35 [Isosphaeraceae bacterium]
MPSIKMKTHKGVKKRFKVTATGKVTHKRCGSSHLNSHKSGKQIRRLRRKTVLRGRAEAQRLRRALQTHEVIRPPRPAEAETEPQPQAGAPEATA